LKDAECHIRHGFELFPLLVLGVQPRWRGPRTPQAHYPPNFKLGQHQPPTRIDKREPSAHNRHHFRVRSFSLSVSLRTIHSATQRRTRHDRTGAVPADLPFRDHAGRDPDTERARPRIGGGRTRGPDDVGRSRLARPHLVRPRRDGGDRHAVHVPLRPARRPREADAGQPAGAVPGRVVERLARRTDLRVRPAQGRAVSQRRPADGRGRQVLLRAVSGGFVRGLQGARRRRRGRRSAAGSLSPEAAVARLPDLLRHAGHRRRWIVPKKYVEKVGDDGFKKAPVGAGRTSSSRSRRGWSWCSRRTSSTGARCRA
jgi:hypothetical protein